ncbi:unnamed protein product [Orchesella dallaii]|uniref:Uncharacterized protein n=1 Tax=Orchesella dallaii TaxID=48710 RepID=A0ABP1S5L1_9HEXA
MMFIRSLFIVTLLSLFTLSLSSEEEAGERSKGGRFTRPPALANMTTPGPEAIQDVGGRVTGAFADNDDDDDDDDEEDDDYESSEESDEDEEEDDEPTAATPQTTLPTPAAPAPQT